MSSDLKIEIEAFEKRKEELEKFYKGKFVLFKGIELVGHWDTFEAAASVAVRRYGSGPYLIRQVGAPPPVLPASLIFKQYGLNNAYR